MAQFRLFLRINDHRFFHYAHGSWEEDIMMLRTKHYGSLAFLIISIGLWTFARSPAWGERIRTATPSGSLNYLSLYVAQEKGMFKDEGFENEIVIIPGPTGIAALLSGDVDYSGAGGSGMRAAVKGAPLKAIMFQTEKVTWYLAAAPEIRKVSDLKGKKIAIGAVGDTLDTLVTTLVGRAGLNANDILRVAMGPSPITRISAVKSGAVQATALDPMSAVVAEKEGLHIVTYLGDLFPFPFQGFLTTDKKIADNPSQVKRWLRSMIRSLIFIRANPEESADIAMRSLKFKNATRNMVVTAVKRFSNALPDGVPGLPSEEGIKTVLEYDVRVPMKLPDPVPQDKVMDFKLVKEVTAELDAKSGSK
jgi:ABC-type nitrate/sulfonate/bicarbonate transport system substrate-binding protein